MILRNVFSRSLPFVAVLSLLTLIPANYAFAATPTTATIDPFDKYFDNTNVELGVYVLLSNITNGDVVYASSTSDVFDGVTPQDNRVVTSTGIHLFGPDAAKYELTNTTATGTGSILPRPLHLVVDNQSKMYGDPDPDFTYGITDCCGLAPGDSLSGTIGRQSGENVGEYAINDLSGLETTFGIENYAPEIFTPGTLSIQSGRLITVTADNQRKDIGDSDPELTYQVTSGSLAPGDSFSGSLVRDFLDGDGVDFPGTYTIHQGTLAIHNQFDEDVTSNYELTFIEATISVQPVPHITNLSFAYPVLGVLTVSWNTDNTVSNTRVVYGRSSVSDAVAATSGESSYGYETSYLAPVKNIRHHVLPLLHLNPGTTYYLRVISTRQGFTTISSEVSATTLGSSDSGTLVINKTVMGGDGSYTFSSPPFSATFTTVPVSTNGGFGYSTITAVKSGSYVFRETFNPESTFVDSTCDEPGEAGGTVIIGATTTCNVINAKNASILIKEVQIGGTGSFEFATDYNSSAILPDGDGSTEYLAGSLTPSVAGEHQIHGTYHVTQSTPDGWLLTGAVCTDGIHTYNPETITLLPGTTVTCTFTNTKNTQPNHQGQINGIVFDDKNGNGVQEVGEPGLGDFMVYLDANNNGVKDNGDITTTSGKDGAYLFKKVPAGTYSMRQVTKPHWALTYPSTGSYSVTVGGPNVNGKNFGNHRN
jgi:plastocyanin